MALRSCFWSLFVLLEVFTLDLLRVPAASCSSGPSL